MAFARAKTALAQFEEKLRRQFGLAGEIGSDLQPIITPVVIAADLREAGNASHRGRWFRWSSQLLGVNSYQSVRPETDILITQIVLSGNTAAANLAEVYLTAPDQAPAVAVATLAGTWTDRKMIATDQCPLTQSASGGAVLGGTDRNDQNRIVSFQSIQGAQLVVELQLMLPQGAAINCRAGASSVLWGFAGRIWP